MVNMGEMVTTERAGVVVWLLSRGYKFTTLEVAKIVGLTPGGAWRLMERLSRRVPIYQEHARWRMVEDEKEQ